MGRLAPAEILILRANGAFPVKGLLPRGWAVDPLFVWALVGGSLFGAERPFFVPSPAIRFAERAEGVKGPKR
jgi:hypothetical protein